MESDVFFLKERMGRFRCITYLSYGLYVLYMEKNKRNDLNGFTKAFLRFQPSQEKPSGEWEDFGDNSFALLAGWCGSTKQTVAFSEMDTTQPIESTELLTKRHRF